MGNDDHSTSMELAPFLHDRVLEGVDRVAEGVTKPGFLKVSFTDWTVDQQELVRQFPGEAMHNPIVRAACRVAQSGGPSWLIIPLQCPHSGGGGEGAMIVAPDRARYGETGRIGVVRVEHHKTRPAKRPDPGVDQRRELAYAAAGFFRRSVPQACGPLPAPASPPKGRFAQLAEQFAAERCLPRDSDDFEAVEEFFLHAEAQRLADEAAAFREKLRLEFEQLFKERLRTWPHETYEDKKDTAKWVNAELRRVGLALGCDCGDRPLRPAILIAGPTRKDGRYILLCRDDKGVLRRPVTATELAKLADKVKLIPAPPEKAGKGNRRKRRRTKPAE